MTAIQPDPEFAKKLAEVAGARKSGQGTPTEKLLKWILGSVLSAAKIGKREKSYRVYHYECFKRANIPAVKEMLVRDFGLTCSEEYERWRKENVLVVGW